MIVHVVYFWLNENCTDEDQLRFQHALDSLVTIETVQFGQTGVPAPNDRPEVESSYSYALFTTFENKADLDIYLIHPTHALFEAAFAHYIAKRQVFSSLSTD